MKGFLLFSIFAFIANLYAVDFDRGANPVKLAFLHFDDINVELLVNGDVVVKERMFDPDPSVGVSHVEEIYMEGCVEFILKHSGMEFRKVIRVDDSVGVVYIDSSQNPFFVQRGSSDILVD